MGREKSMIRGMIESPVVGRYSHMGRRKTRKELVRPVCSSIISFEQGLGVFR